MDFHSKNTGVGCRALLQGMLQSCPTLCNPTDCSLPGSSVHEIFQARILVWVAVSFSRESFGPRDGTQVSLIAWGQGGSASVYKVVFP